MDQIRKTNLLAEAEAHLRSVKARLEAELSARQVQLAEDAAAYRRIKGETAAEDRMRALAVGEISGKFIEDIKQVEASPYFARVDLEFDNESIRPYYLGKFAYPEASIYSWTSPLAALRFEEVGKVTYQTPKNGLRAGVMERKDQYMITGDQLMFMASEATRYERQLIHQERLTNRKTGFILPEIVAQMERAQDQVIRAGYKGPLAISGPAGSGKTTLALHRIAYLCQLTDMAELFPARNIIVFVNDYNTQDYFSHLLPELGINDVQITTFPAWALAQLELRQFFYRLRPGNNENERDSYEWAKLQALKSAIVTEYDPQRIAIQLKEVYGSYLTPGQKDLLDLNLGEGALDRYDLTLLLMAKSRRQGGLNRRVEIDKFYPGGRVRTKVEYQPLAYSLILIDEFQNYLPQQLKLLRAAADSATGALLYVGDIAQRTSPGSMRDWSEIGEMIEPERLVRLEKVYRNTRQILEYIRELGFAVEIPRGILEGPGVVEQQVETFTSAVTYVQGLISAEEKTIGVIVLDPDTLEAYESALKGEPGVRCMTIREAQGVEFDIVCLVGIDAQSFSLPGVMDMEFLDEKRRINQDLLYVALTRPISELHIIGSGSIREYLRRGLAGV